MSDYRFGFTGTRDGMTWAQRLALRTFIFGSSGEFHHGDCIGADSEAHDIADDCGYCIIIHPPSDYRLRAWRLVPSALMRRETSYMARNREIVNDTIALIAAPLEHEEQPRGGTWSTVRYARKIGRSVIVIFPDGKIKQESARSIAA